MKTCDACDEQWDDAFFCPVCSKGVHLEEEEVPDIMWDCDPRTPETIIKEVWVRNGDICLNCCPGHRKDKK